MDLWFDHVFFISCICLFCQNIKIYMDTSWVICFSCKSIYIDSIVFKRYVCILIALTKHTYAMKYNCWFSCIKNLWWFSCYQNLKEYWVLLPFSWYLAPHNTSHSLLCDMDFMDRVFLVPCDLLVKNLLIYSLVEGFLTSC